MKKSLKNLVDNKKGQKLNDKQSSQICGGNNGGDAQNYPLIMSRFQLGDSV